MTLACTVLLLTGCTTTVAGSSTVANSSLAPPPATSETETPSGDQPDPELVREVERLYEGCNDAWEQGLVAGVTYQAEHNHPLLDYSFEECIAGYEGFPDTYVESIEADVDTLEPDPGWTVDIGRYVGQDLEGDVYTLDTTVRYGDPAADPDLASEETPVHVAFLDGETYFFFVCEPIE